MNLLPTVRRGVPADVAGAENLFVRDGTGLKVRRTMRAVRPRLRPVETEHCPLCGALAASVGRSLNRLHCACPVCDLRFIPPAFHLSPEQEYERYLCHQNSLSNSGYVKFLMVAVDCFKTHIRREPGVSPTILDYGSGPGPVLVKLLNREGFAAVGYDPIFGDRSEPGMVVTGSLAGQGPFDAVVSTETVEHFRTPRAEWEQMTSLIRPDGLLVVVTSLVLPGINLSNWYYAHDPTHISFYSESTFRYIGEQLGLSWVATNGSNWVVMRKRSAV